MNKPTLFELTGDHVHISYSTTSFIGGPQLFYQNLEQHYTFHREEVRTQESELGTLISVSLKKPVDAAATILTLVLPDIQLDGYKPSSFKTLAIIVQCLNVLPQRGGARQTYEVLNLQGRGRFVVF